MNEIIEAESKIVLPLVGSVESVQTQKHISVEVLEEAEKQVDEHLKKIDGMISQFQEQANNAQNMLNQARINKTALAAQKAILGESRKKIIELITPVNNA